MNYAAHYDRLIARARDRILTGYRERHHVIPRCMGGNNEPSNVVELTAEEHYVAHQLLVKMYPTQYGLVHAAVRMAWQCSGNKVYGWLRRRHAEASRARMVGNTFAIVRSEEHRMKLRNSHLGKKLPPEQRAKMSASQKGKVISEAQRAKQSTTMKGRGLGSKRPRTAEHQEKIAAANRGKKENPAATEKRRTALTGRKLSAEHKANIAAANRGRKNYPAAIEKTAAARRGLKHTPEARAKMSASLMGRKNGPPSEETRAKMRATHLAIWARGEGKNKWTTPSSSAF